MLLERFGRSGFIYIWEWTVKFVLAEWSLFSLDQPLVWEGFLQYNIVCWHAVWRALSERPLPWSCPSRCGVCVTVLHPERYCRLCEKNRATNAAPYCCREANPRETTTWNCCTYGRLWWPGDPRNWWPLENFVLMGVENRLHVSVSYAVAEVNSFHAIFLRNGVNNTSPTSTMLSPSPTVRDTQSCAIRAPRDGGQHQKVPFDLKVTGRTVW